MSRRVWYVYLPSLSRSCYVRLIAPKIEKILKGVENERLATTLVPKLLKQLEQMAKRCEDGTEVMDKKFKAWLENSQDILKACLSSKGK